MTFSLPKWLLPALWLLITAPIPGDAQQNQCRTAPVGTSSATCASEAFVTNTAAARPYFEAYLSANQSPVVDSTLTLINIDTIIKDSNSWFDTTAHLFTPQLAGSYLVTMQVRCIGTTISNCVADIRLNGSSYARALALPVTANTNADASVTAIVPVNGSTDNISAYGLVTGTGTEGFLGAVGPIRSYLLAQYIGP
jgi:hypothetical protein